MKRIFIVLAILWSSRAGLVQDFPKTSGCFEPADRETLVFIGNSITHQCLYTQYVEDYFYTRFPDRRISFRNAGVSGDKARDVLVRFDEDVAAFHPKITTVLIGMNDGEYTSYDQKRFDVYRRDMTKVLDKIEAAGSTAVLMTPTIYDQQVALKGGNWVLPDTARVIHYDAVLAFFGAWVLEQANRRGLGFANLWEPLNRITREQRETDPNFTLIPDAVHPDANGQLVMALALLRDIRMPAVVSRIELFREGGRWVFRTENGRLGNSRGDKIDFQFTANSLPWVVPDEASLGFRITNAGTVLSREILRVVGLEPGDHKLLIDGRTVGVFHSRQFADGIELQGNKETPEYNQALAVALINKQRNDEAVRPLRDLWEERKARLHFEENPMDTNDEDSRRFTSVPYAEWLAAFHAKTDSLTRKAGEFEEKIYLTNKPKSHRYEILKAE
jgi:lysophospholipase L1-like esterase